MNPATISYRDAFPRDQNILVAEIFRRYRQDRPVILGHVSRSPSAEKDRDRVMDEFLGMFGQRRVLELAKGDLVEWIGSHPRWASAWTRRRVSNTVQAAFNYATDIALIDRNPFKGLKFPKGQPGRDLSDAEWRALLRVVRPNYRRILVFLRFSGCRPAELRKLEWGQINLAARVIVQREHKTLESSGRPRRIPLCTQLVKLLIWMKRRESGSKSPIVFQTVFGRAWTKRGICQALDRARTRAGLPKDAKLYGCRHAYGTNAILNGVDIATLAQLMGHQTTRTTEVYVHLAGKDEWLSQMAEKATRSKSPKDAS